MKLVVHNDKPLPPPPPPSESDPKKMAQCALVRMTKLHPRTLIIIADVGEDEPEVWTSGLSRNEALRLVQIGTQRILEDI